MANNFVITDLIAELAPEEGERYFAYDDASGQAVRKGTTVMGNVTVGIGRNLSGKGLTDAEARYLCANDIVEISDTFDKMIPWWRDLSPARQRAVANMGFNMGPMELVNGWPHFLGAMRVGNWAGAIAELQSSHWWGQVGTRAEKIAAQILAG
ncbi:MAG TPA: glycoside hydrolase family protein [Acidocella sp.]|nr:glycoside hydrolase family protein [Acidocella sp.]